MKRVNGNTFSASSTSTAKRVGNYSMSVKDYSGRGGLEANTKGKKDCVPIETQIHNSKTNTTPY